MPTGNGNELVHLHQAEPIVPAGHFPIGTSRGNLYYSIDSGWWFGCHFLNFPRNIGLLIIPIDFHIFQRGWNHQPVHVFLEIHYLGNLQFFFLTFFLWDSGSANPSFWWAFVKVPLSHMNTDVDVRYLLKAFQCIFLYQGTFCSHSNWQRSVAPSPMVSESFTQPVESENWDVLNPPGLRNPLGQLGQQGGSRTIPGMGALWWSQVLEYFSNLQAQEAHEKATGLQAKLLEQTRSGWRSCQFVVFLYVFVQCVAWHGVIQKNVEDPRNCGVTSITETDDKMVRLWDMFHSQTIRTLIFCRGLTAFHDLCGWATDFFQPARAKNPGYSNDSNPQRLVEKQDTWKRWESIMELPSWWHSFQPLFLDWRLPDTLKGLKTFPLFLTILDRSWRADGQTSISSGFQVDQWLEIG